MLRKISIITIFTVMGIMQAAQPTGAGSIAAAATVEQRNVCIFNETQLLSDVQDIVLGYVGKKGWQLEKSMRLETNNFGAMISNLYYVGDLLIAIDRHPRIIFCEHKSIEEIKRLENQLAQRQWHENSALGLISSHKLWINNQQVLIASNKYVMDEDPNGNLALHDKSVYAIQEAPEIIKKFEKAWTTRTIYIGRCFSWDEKYFAISSSNMDHDQIEIIIYDLIETQKKQILKLEFSSKSEHIKALAMSPDNKYIAIPIENKIVVINIATKEKEIIIAEPQISGAEEDKIRQNRIWIDALTYSSCGKYIIAALSDGTINRYEYQPDLNNLK